MVFSRSSVHAFASVHVNIQVIGYFLVSLLLALAHVSTPFVFRSITYVHHILMNNIRKWLHSVLRSLVYLYMVCMYLELYNVIYLSWFNILVLCSRNIDPNPGPVANQFNFSHWNLNGLMAHDKLKITLIEAYSAIYHYDVIAISETFLNSNIDDSDVYIQHFSHDVFRKDHPNDTSRENLPITRETILKSLTKQ